MSPSSKKTVSPELSKVVERQLRNWELQRAQHLQSAREEEKPVHEFVAISRAVGLDASKIGDLLHKELGWPLFDREILHVMAGSDDYRQRLYANMDGRDLSWLEGFARGLTLGRYQPNDYFHRLAQTMLSIARQSRAIFIGRGACYILPQATGLRVRLTAPEEFCVACYARQKDLSHEEAVREVREITEEREEFVRKHFYAQWSDPAAYDITINMVNFSAEQTAGVILSALRLRGLAGEATSPR